MNLHVLVVFFLTVALTLADESDPCKLITGGGQSVLAIGELELNNKLTIMIVTKDWKILNVDAKALDTKNHTFNLKGADIRPLEEVYPKFRENSKFQADKEKIFSGRIHDCDPQTTIDLELILSVHHKFGYRYDIRKDKFISGRAYRGTSGLYYLLPKRQSREFWGFTKGHYTNFLISFWKENPRTEIIKMKREYKLCLTQNDQIYISEQDQCEKTVDWSKKRGFVSDGYAFLFDETKVSIFPASLLGAVQEGNLQLHAEYKEKNYNQFFDCSGTANVSNAVFSMNNKFPWLIVLLIILLIILVCCLCLGTMAAVKHKKKKSLEQRSSLIPVFGMLSRASSKLNKSIRSKLTPTSVNKLSRNPSRMKTVRSSNLVSNAKLTRNPSNGTNNSPRMNRTHRSHKTSLACSFKSQGTIRSRMKGKSQK